MSRKYTNQLLELVEEGCVDKDVLIQALALYLSDSDVKRVMELNEIQTQELEFN